MALIACGSNNERPIIASGYKLNNYIQMTEWKWLDECHNIMSRENEVAVLAISHFVQ